MKQEHREFKLMLIKDKWIVFCLDKKVSSGFNTKPEAEEYKKYLKSR